MSDWRSEEYREQWPATNIDWMSIGQAQCSYYTVGYEYLEVPWLVGREAVDITKPPHARNFETFAGCLVASGEQSFLAVRDSLERGKKYQCVTPCFRDEQQHDELHRQWFVKLELMYVLMPWDIREDKVLEVVQDALDFFWHFACGCELRVVRTENGYDIEVNGVEVGSYGYREYNGFRWVYGTGIAQPRFAQAFWTKPPEGAVLVQVSGRGVPRVWPRQELQGEGVRAEA